MSAPEVIANRQRAAELVGGWEILEQMRAAGWVQELPCSTRKTQLFSVEKLTAAACRLVRGDELAPRPFRLKAKAKRAQQLEAAHTADGIE